MRLVFQDGTEWDIRADVEFAGLIIWAAICPNSLRPEFIPINFKTLVWQTGAVPEKPFRSKSVTYANPMLKTAKLRLITMDLARDGVALVRIGSHGQTCRIGS